VSAKISGSVYYNLPFVNTCSSSTSLLKTSSSWPPTKSQINILTGKRIETTCSVFATNDAQNGAKGKGNAT
jgi:hypothetical protein